MKLVDTVESNWRGVLDLLADEINDELYGIVSNSVSFGLWATP